MWNNIKILLYYIINLEEHYLRVIVIVFEHQLPTTW